MHYPKPIKNLITALKSLPGVGARTAERYAFAMLKWPDEQLKELARRVNVLQDSLIICEQCGCLLDRDGCTFCDPQARQTDFLCVVASPKDVFSLEATRHYHGLYHVLGGLLSPLDGRGPRALAIPKLQARLAHLPVREIILALDSTVEGDATALFLREELAAPGRQISRLALGLPLGSPLEYIDAGTLARALVGRHQA